MARVLQCPRCRALVDDDRRSPSEHGAFFAFLQWCVSRWPAEHAFTPSNKDHLRAWAMTRIEFEGSYPWRAPSMTWPFATERERKVLEPFIHGLIAPERREGRYVWSKINGRGIELIRAKSINWKTVGQREFHAIFEDVINFIAQVAELNFDDWKAMEKPGRAAA